MSAKDPAITPLLSFTLSGVQHGTNNGATLFIDDVYGRLGFAATGSLPPFYIDADQETQLLELLQRRQVGKGN